MGDEEEVRGVRDPAYRRACCAAYATLSTDNRQPKDTELRVVPCLPAC